MIRRLARAKVNLALHVTGQREDGYHLLDSLVVFPEIGDVVEVAPADQITLSIGGPFGDGLPTTDNLVTQAAEALRPATAGAALHLDKYLPVASGIGGGSADAAAALQALAELWACELPGDLALRLGADVPVCLMARAARMRGIGDVVDPLSALPEFSLLLVNSGRPLATPDVFRGILNKDNPGLGELPEWRSASDLAIWLSETRNDLQDAATRLDPEIGHLLDAMSALEGCHLARMSGSGGTCFGLFATQSAAERARDALCGTHPDHWVVAAPVAAVS